MDQHTISLEQPANQEFLECLPINEEERTILEHIEQYCARSPNDIFQYSTYSPSARFVFEVQRLFSCIWTQWQGRVALGISNIGLCQIPDETLTELCSTLNGMVGNPGNGTNDGQSHVLGDNHEDNVHCSEEIDVCILENPEQDMNDVQFQFSYENDHDYMNSCQAIAACNLEFLTFIYKNFNMVRLMDLLREAAVLSYWGEELEYE